MNKVVDFFNNNEWARLGLDAYLSFVVIIFIVFLALKYKKAFNLVIIGVFVYLFSYLARYFDLPISNAIYEKIAPAYLIICFILLSSDLVKLMDYRKKVETKSSEYLLTANQHTIEEITKAVFKMSSEKVGALISIEQHSSLEQFSENAISLNSDISSQLLEQIFIKDSPLHDGAVIIRGNKIICAAAFFTLTQNTELDKTLGSRHRAAIGISEVADAITIVVSEETGDVHITHSAIMKKIDSENDLQEYLTLYLGK